MRLAPLHSRDDSPPNHIRTGLFLGAILFYGRRSRLEGSRLALLFAGPGADQNLFQVYERYTKWDANIGRLSFESLLG